MGEIHKGKVLIKREELIDAFELPSEVDFLDIEVDFSGDIVILIATDKPFLYRGRNVTHSAKLIRESGGISNFRRLVLTNKYRPKYVQD